MNSKQIQLFIFPYAGASIASFKRIIDLLDPHIEVIPVEYAGRGTRAKDKLAGSLQEMIEDAIQYCLMRRKNDVPYAIFGYSMGNILGYEILSHKLIEGELKHFFVAAEVSPQTRALELRQEVNPTDELVLNRARELGGLDERIVNNKRFADIYLKPMISDYKHFFEYRFDGTGEMIDCNATFFYCEKDTPYEDVEKWKQLMTGKASFYEMGDNHFFINQEYQQMAKIINLDLNEYLIG